MNIDKEELEDTFVETIHQIANIVSWESGVGLGVWIQPDRTIWRNAPQVNVELYDYRDVNVCIASAATWINIYADAEQIAKKLTEALDEALESAREDIFRSWNEHLEKYKQSLADELSQAQRISPSRFVDVTIGLIPTYQSKE